LELYFQTSIALVPLATCRKYLVDRSQGKRAAFGETQYYDIAIIIQIFAKNVLVFLTFIIHVTTSKNVFKMFYTKTFAKNVAKHFKQDRTRLEDRDSGYM